MEQQRPETPENGRTGQDRDTAVFQVKQKVGMR